MDDEEFMVSVLAGMTKEEFETFCYSLQCEAETSLDEETNEKRGKDICK